MSSQGTVRIGTRGSELALAQASWVSERISHDHPGLECRLTVVSTTGDEGVNPPGLQLGDGIFVKEIQQALLKGEIDVAVHSLKDLPTEPVPGLVIAAVPVRADPRDCLVGLSLKALKRGTRVATGSPRRTAQLRHLCPEIDIVPIRGNVPTRISKVKDGLADAVVLAAAGLARLGLVPDEFIDFEKMLPAPGQGALAIETTDGHWLGPLLSSLHDKDTRDAVVAERVALRELGGGCLLPVAALGLVADGRLRVRATVTSADGKIQIGQEESGDANLAVGIGKRVARGLAAQGAAGIL